MEADNVDVLFLAPSADLEYLTGIERQIPNFGEASYANGWVTGAFLRPGADPVFVFPRMFAAFDLREEPEGELVIVNETDDGFAIFERVARGLGSTGTVAVGDRVWAETVLNLGRILGFDRLRTGSMLVNELRRVKTPEELEAIGRAIRTVEQAMAAVGRLVVPGATMAQLAEAVEHELRAAGSRTPSFTTHIFTGLGDGELDSGTETAHAPIPDGPRDRPGRPRAAVHLHGGRDAARARNDVHRRAVDHHPGPLQRPDRGHRRLRGRRRANTQRLSRRPRRERLITSAPPA